MPLLTQLIQDIINNPQQGMQNLAAALQKPGGLQTLISGALTSPAYAQGLSLPGQNPTLSLPSPALTTAAGVLPDAARSIHHSRLEVASEAAAARSWNATTMNLSSAWRDLTSGNVRDAWNQTRAAAGNLWDAGSHQANAIGHDIRATQYAVRAGDELDRMRNQAQLFVSPAAATAMNKFMAANGMTGADLTRTLQGYNDQLDKQSPTILGRII